MEALSVEQVTQLAADRAASTTGMVNPFIVDLPLGDTIGGWNIDFTGWTGNEKKIYSSQWLSQGHDGILFKGKGRDLTRIRPIADDNFFIGPHNAYVAFESCTIGVRSFVGKGKAVHMGLANQPVYPNMKLIFRDVKFDAEAAFVWGVFTYQCDVEFIDCEFAPSMEQGREHNFYAHGFAREGVNVQNVTMHACGAECLKFTARPTECRWVPNPVVRIRNSVFKNWFQPHSWRGGAGLVSQASTCHFLIENTLYYGNISDYNKSKCVMIDGNGGGDYHVNTGAIGNGPSTGHVILRYVGMGGAVGPAWYSPIMRIGNNGGTNPHCALSLNMTNCGVYGKFRQIQIHGPQGDNFKGRGLIANCNTPEIRDYMFARGFIVDEEARIDAGFIPVSQGIVIARD